MTGGSNVAPATTRSGSQKLAVIKRVCRSSVGKLRVRGKLRGQAPVAVQVRDKISGRMEDLGLPLVLTKQGHNQVEEFRGHLCGGDQLIARAPVDRRGPLERVDNVELVFAVRKRHVPAHGCHRVHGSREVPQSGVNSFLDVVKRGAAKRLGDTETGRKAEEFFDKIIQVPFQVPEATETALMKFLADQLKRFDIDEKKSDGAYVKLALRSVGTNPRSIKRLFNTFLLVRSIASKRGEQARDDLAVFAALCFQTSFQEDYDALQTELRKQGSKKIEANDTEAMLSGGDDSADLDPSLRSFLTVFDSVFVEGGSFGWERLNRAMDSSSVTSRSKEEVITKRGSEGDFATMVELLSQQNVLGDIQTLGIGFANDLRDDEDLPILFRSMNSDPRDWGIYCGPGEGESNFGTRIGTLRFQKKTLVLSLSSKEKEDSGWLDAKLPGLEEELTAPDGTKLALARSLKPKSPDIQVSQINAETPMEPLLRITREVARRWYELQNTVPGSDLAD